MSSKSEVSGESLASLIESIISEKKNICYSELNFDWQWGSDVLEFRDNPPCGTCISTVWSTFHRFREKTNLFAQEIWSDKPGWPVDSMMEENLACAKFVWLQREFSYFRLRGAWKERVPPEWSQEEFKAATAWGAEDGVQGKGHFKTKFDFDVNQQGVCEITTGA